MGVGRNDLQGLFCYLVILQIQRIASKKILGMGFGAVVSGKQMMTIMDKKGWLWEGQQRWLECHMREFLV